jgi:hypothetical protein
MCLAPGADDSHINRLTNKATSENLESLLTSRSVRHLTAPHHEKSRHAQGCDFLTSETVLLK